MVRYRQQKIWPSCAVGQHEEIEMDEALQKRWWAEVARIQHQQGEIKAGKPKD